MKKKYLYMAWEYNKAYHKSKLIPIVNFKSII